MAINYIDNNYTISYYKSITGSYSVANRTIIPGEVTTTNFSSSFIVTGSNDNISSFSYSTFISGSKAVFGAPGASGNSGKVYIFNKISDSWILETSISGANQPDSAGTYFGGYQDASVTYLQQGNPLWLRGNRILVGAPREETDKLNNPSHYKGAVYLFTSGAEGYSRSRIFHEAVTGSNRATGFGQSVLLGDDFFAVSAPNEYSTPGASSGPKTGVVFIYGYDYSSGNNYRQILTSSTNGVQFGQGLAFDETNRLLMMHNLSGVHRVDVYNSSSADGWKLKQSISGNDSFSSSDFGFAVDACEDYLIVGARHDQPGGDSLRGSAFIYYYDGSSYSINHVISGSSAGELFGRTVSISKSGSVIYAAIGSQEDNGSGEDGALSIYKSSSSGWEFQTKLTSSSDDNSGLDDDYAISCKIHGSNLAVGSFGEETYGRGYIYQASSSAAPDTTLTKHTKPIFRFSSRGAFNIRSQSSSSSYTTFIGNQKS